MSNPQKRILYVYQGTYPWEVRVEKFCHTLRDNNFECMVLCRWGAETAERSDDNNVTIQRVGFRKSAMSSLPTSANPMWRSAIKRAVAEFQPDIIIAREMLIATACKDAAKGKCAVVLDMAEHYPAAMRSWKKYRENVVGRTLVHTFDLPSRIEKRAVESSDAIILVCEENLERVHQRYDYPRSQMWIVHNTPRLAEADGVRQNSSNPARVFSYQGWVTRERGVERLVRSFDEAATQDVDIELIIAGGGESIEDVRTVVSDATHNNRIQLLGAFQHEQLKDILSQTDVGVIAFDQDEFRQHTIPNKLFDYMLCGKPVIVSACAPMARIVHESGCGIVVDVNIPDQLRKSIHHMREMDLSSMSMAGRNAALQTYHWEHDAESLVQCINSML